MDHLHYFPRDIDAGDLLELFLVSAVVSVLVIRVFLHLTGYPTIGNTNFHIAHMLWGGMLMMIALVGLFIFLNKEVKYIAAVVGGIGFGTFIDELGKFITNDNNYFFRPTIAFIYVLFVLLFLGARAAEKYFTFSKEEYAINALEMAKQVLMHDLDTQEKKQTLNLLKKSDKDNPIVKVLISSLNHTVAKPVAAPNILHKLRDWAGKSYIKIIQSPTFTKNIIIFFVIVSFVNFIQSLLNISSAVRVSEWGQLIFSSLSGILVLIGVYFLRYEKSRLRSYQFFKYAVLVSIFLTQFFRFWEEQFSAITGLFLSLIILSVLQYLIYEEKFLGKRSF